MSLLHSLIRQPVFILASALVVAGIVVPVWMSPVPVLPVSDLIRQGRRALAGGDSEKALAMATRVLDREPESVQGQMLAGDAASDLNQFLQAVEYYDRIPDLGSRLSVRARCAAGELLLMERKRILEAEAQFRRALAQNPHSAMANDRMAYLLRLGSQNRAAVRYRLALIQQGVISAYELWLLAIGDEILQDEHILEAYRTTNPENSPILAALARHAMEQQNFVVAKALLRLAVQLDPECPEPQYMLGRLIDEVGTPTAFSTWASAVPKTVFEHPELWMVFGDASARRGHTKEAVRCFWEAIRREPGHRLASYRLGQRLGELGRSDEAAPFVERSIALQEYRQAAKLAYKFQSLDRIQAAAEAARSLGLFWESYGWAVATMKIDRLSGWAASWIAQLRPVLADQPLERTAAEHSPTLTVDLSSEPLPDWSLPATNSENRSTQPLRAPPLTFVDRAADVDVCFEFFSGHDPHGKHLKKIYEVGGGGVAALDFDGDGWPDLWWTQGSDRLISRNGQPAAVPEQKLDRVFRNLRGARFSDVTSAAGVADVGFSQGISAGDFDQDGFPDVYVANIGRNRLYRNNGDGTFSDLTDFAGVGSERWTTSCMIADLNQDSLPDIFAVNYVEGDDVFERSCPNETSGASICLPQVFSASGDQVFLNDGHGHFADCSREALSDVPSGRGLGILATRGNDGEIAVFVANDGDANAYLLDSHPSRGGVPQFVDMAWSQGLAVNGNGLPEACMGVAAGDADGDGRLDIFVTNYWSESNTLYGCIDGVMFADRTDAVGLGRPSLPFLGFGTQFLDADLDGALDLVVSNGHVDVGTGAYAMRPQCFRNTGNGYFQELVSETIGPWFCGEYLGRGMARLDWNADGREEVAVSHLDAPAALLENTSVAHPDFVAIRLRGVVSDREATGATVTLRTSDRTIVRYLTAGDGYQASNEKRMVFGMGSGSVPLELTVRWPSGRQQTVSRIPVNCELIWVEGQTGPMLLPLRSVVRADGKSN